MKAPILSFWTSCLESEKQSLDVFLEVTVFNSLDFEIMRENGNPVRSGGFVTPQGIESNGAILLDQLSAGVYIVKLSNQTSGAAISSNYSFRID